MGIFTRLMKVQKRDGRLQDVTFDKIVSRLRKLTGSEHTGIDVVQVASVVIGRMYDGIPTHTIDDVSATVALSLMRENHEYGTLATRLYIDNWKKKNWNADIPGSVTETYMKLTGAFDPKIKRFSVFMCDQCHTRSTEYRVLKRHVETTKQCHGATIIERIAEVEVPPPGTTATPMPRIKPGPKPRA